MDGCTLLTIHGKLRLNMALRPLTCSWGWEVRVKPKKARGTIACSLKSMITACFVTTQWSEIR